MEAGLLPPEPVVEVVRGPEEIDGRGWLMAVVAMVLIGLWSLRPSPHPSEPRRILHAESHAWMADALPGIGAKTRDLQWQRIRSGEIAALPERARAIARQIFIWPEAHHSTDSAIHPHR